MRFLSNEDIQGVLDMKVCLEALRVGYRDLANGQATYIPRIDLWAPTGRENDYYRWGSMTGACSSYNVLATRIKSDVIYWVDDGIRKTEKKYCIEPGTYSGIILLYALDNGRPLALMHDGYLQHMRVGGCAGLGTEVLARLDANKVGIIGSGGMARSYLEAIAEVRYLKSGRVFSPNPKHRAQYCEEMSRKLNLVLEPVVDAETAVRGADILITATDATEPTFDADWVTPGTHVVCVSRREVGRDLLDRADVIRQLGYSTIPYGANVPGVEWSNSGAASYIMGCPEERSLVPRIGKEKMSKAAQYPFLLNVVQGQLPGRTSPEQITLFINTGTQGLQFAAVGGRVLQIAAERNLGQQLLLEWFIEDIRN